MLRTGRLLTATAPLGGVDAARSRHAWRRSSTLVRDEAVVAGRRDGTVSAHTLDGDASNLAERWATPLGDADAGADDATETAVALAAFAGGVAVGGRGALGRVALLDAATGTTRWTYDTVGDVGEATTDSVFYRPYVVALRADGGNDRLYAAARRYERAGDERSWESAVYALGTDGGVRWRYRADASPIALDAAGDRVAVAYNRCPGDHDAGLVLLDAATGEAVGEWDPDSEGERRVGDVSLSSDSAHIAVTSHADYRGYLLDADCEERWRADLAAEVEAAGQTLYAYPNHVHLDESGVVFVTGNTYARESRETEARHPDEHTAFGYAPDGERRWTADIGGFAGGLAAEGSMLAVPCAQNFRVRDADSHALRVFDVRAGPVTEAEAEGVVTAASLDGAVVSAVEEPVEYHDEERTRGRYALRAGRFDA